MSYRREETNKRILGRWRIEAAAFFSGRMFKFRNYTTRFIAIYLLIVTKFFGFLAEDLIRIHLV